MRFLSELSIFPVVKSRTSGSWGKHLSFRLLHWDTIVYIPDITKFIITLSAILIPLPTWFNSTDHSFSLQLQESFSKLVISKHMVITTIDFLLDYSRKGYISKYSSRITNQRKRKGGVDSLVWLWYLLGN